jgi:protein-S-isoprenylcysteine O-methyltransferase Ste14
MSDVGISFRIDSLPVLIGTATLILWLSSERLLHLLGLRQGRPTERETLSSYWHTVSFYGAIVYSFLDSTTFHWTTVGPHLSSVRYAGVPLLLVGFVVRIVSRLALGKQFSGHVQTTENHRLVTTGIYGSIRHPAYLGYLCLLVGFPITFGSIGGLACAFALGIPALIYRIRIEESALERWFPDEYHVYRAKTRRLIPFLW